MRLKKLPPECIAPFRLKEITLHGIGSYYKPARLEIKPLTMLCGTNGSGKSTWMKVLSTLKEALDPLRDDDGKIIESNYLVRLDSAMIKKDLLNQNLFLGTFTDIHDPAWKTHEGPQGSFSVTYVCTKPVKLEDVYQTHPDAYEIPVLQINELKRGDVICLRFTQSRHLDGTYVRFYPGCQITINNDVASVYFGQVEAKGECKVMLQLGRRGTDAQENGEGLSQVGGALSKATFNALSLMCEQLISQCLTGYFKISAIRNIYDEIEEGEHVASSRYVGENGKYTHYFQRHFSTAPMLDPRKGYSYCGTKSNEDVMISSVEDSIVNLQVQIEKLKEEGYTWTYEEGFVKKATKAKNVDVSSFDLDDLLDMDRSDQRDSDGLFKAAVGLLDISLFCEYLFSHHYEELVTFQKELQKRILTSGPEISVILKRVSAFMVKGKGVIIDRDYIRFRRSDVCLDFLSAAKGILEILRNEILLKPTFFRWCIHEFEKGSFKDGLPVEFEKIPSWVMYLSTIPDSELHPDDRETLNEWALENFIEGQEPCPCIGLKCTMVFNWWSYYLLGVEVKALGVWGYSTRSFVGERNDPVGYIENFSMPKTDEVYYPERTYSNRFLGNKNGSFEDATYKPGTFSAGLHQVSPILVQMNMMKMNEVLAVENPEVHLHPGLQLKFMSFFIENALIGKFSLIETHSDLMIRRAWRAIQEEKLPQSWVNIYFVDEEQVEGKDIWTSKIDRLWLNERGQISNWPKGFLDADEQEAEALLSAKLDKPKGEVEDE